MLASPGSVVITEDYGRRIWGDEDPMGKTLVFNINEDPVIVGGIMAPMTNTSVSAVLTTSASAMNGAVDESVIRIFNQDQLLLLFLLPIFAKAKSRQPPTV